MVLGSNQPLTEMSIRNIFWEVMVTVRRTDIVTTFMSKLSLNLESSTSWNPQGFYRICFTLTFTFTFTNQKSNWKSFSSQL
jgi:hypothetical protein